MAYLVLPAGTAGANQRTAPGAQAERHLRLLHAAAEYAAVHGNLQVPTSHITADGMRLGEALRWQRRRATAGTIDPDTAAALSELDASWQVPPPRRARVRRVDHVVSAAHERMLEAAVQFCAEHGHLWAPSRYRTGTGLGLGQWLNTRRREHRHGGLRPEIGARLEEIHSGWAQPATLRPASVRVKKTPDAPTKWHLPLLAAAAEYVAVHGHLNVPRGHVAAGGFALGQSLRQQRRQVAQGAINAALARRLSELDPHWAGHRSAQTALDRMFQAAHQFDAEHGHLRVPSQHRTVDGLNLGMWLVKRRAKLRHGRLDRHTLQRLNAIDLSWTDGPRPDQPSPARWRERLLAAASMYLAEHGNLRVPDQYVARNGLRLGEALRRQRRRAQAGTGDSDLARQLTALDRNWTQKPSVAALTRLLQATRRYHAEHGHLHVPRRYHTPKGLDLGQWIAACRRRHRDGVLRPDVRDQLEALDPAWAQTLRHPPRPTRPKAWAYDRTGSEHYGRLLAAAAAYTAAYGDLAVPGDHRAEDGLRLGQSLRWQRRRAVAGTIDPGLARQLSELDPEWMQRRPRRRTAARALGHVSSARLEWMLKAAHRFHAEYGHLQVPTRYRSESGLNLGRWLAARRHEHRRETLRPTTRQRLDAINPAWTGQPAAT